MERSGSLRDGQIARCGAGTATCGPTRWAALVPVFWLTDFLLASRLLCDIKRRAERGARATAARMAGRPERVRRGTARGCGRLHLACPPRASRPAPFPEPHRAMPPTRAGDRRAGTYRPTLHGPLDAASATRFAHPRTVVRGSLRPRPTRRESVMRGDLPLSPPASRNAPHARGRGRRLDDEQSNERSNRRGFAGFAARCARAFIRLDWRRCRIRRTIKQRGSRGPLRRPSLVIVLPMR